MLIKSASCYNHVGKYTLKEFLNNKETVYNHITSSVGRKSLKKYMKSALIISLSNYHNAGFIGSFGATLLTFLGDLFLKGLQWNTKLLSSLISSMIS